MSAYPECHEKEHCYNAQYRGERKLCRVLASTDYESGKCPFFKAKEDAKSGDYSDKKGDR